MDSHVDVYVNALRRCLCPCYDCFMQMNCMFKNCMDQQACLLSHIRMTHKVNLADDQIEEEYQLACEELAKESNEKEDDPPQA